MTSIGRGCFGSGIRPVSTRKCEARQSGCVKKCGGSCPELSESENPVRRYPSGNATLPLAMMVVSWRPYLLTFSYGISRYQTWGPSPAPWPFRKLAETYDASLSHATATLKLGELLQGLRFSGSVFNSQRSLNFMWRVSIWAGLGAMNCKWLGLGMEVERTRELQPREAQG